MSALRLVWRKLWLLPCVFVFVLAWMAAFFLWLGIPVATLAQIALQIAGALLLLGLPLYGGRALFRALGGSRPRWNPHLLAALPLAFLGGVYLPYRLIWWIPALPSFAGQTLSAALRFAAAGLLFSLALLWLTAMLVGSDTTEQ
jgi:hypothetical protein